MTAPGRPSGLATGLPVALVLAACLAVPLGAQAQAPAQRGLVVRGRVAGATSRWDGSQTLYTYVSIDVIEAIVGQAPARLVLKQLGGEAGGIGLWVAGQAAFTTGEDVLLDLEVATDGTLHTRRLGLGKWRVMPGSEPGALQVIQAGSAAGAEYAAVRLALQRVRQAAEVFSAVPAEFAAAPRADAPAFQYLPTDGGFPARWHEVDSGTPLFVDHPGSLPGSWTGGTSGDVGDAIGLWRASGMDLDLRDGGNSLPSGQCPVALEGNGSGRIKIAYNDPCGGVADWVIGGGYYTTADLRTVNGTTFQKFLQGFVVLNTTGPHTSSSGCFQDAITHGLGHALGLGHSSAAGAIMNAAPPSGCASGPAALGADDTAGITAIYQGIASGAAPPDTPTALTATAVLSTVTIAWTPASTGGAAQQYIIDAGQAPGVYNVGAIPINAPATSTSVGNVPAGTYYVRVRASNALGASAPSAEQSVTVGACALPGAPASFTATSTDTAVSLQWTPGSGVVQGYQLEAGSAPSLADLAVLPYPATTTALAASVPYGQYYTRVRATNVCGAGPPSPEVLLNVQPCTAAPGTPTGLMAGVSGGLVSLQWTAAAGAPAASYTLVVGSVPGGSDILVYPTGTTATALGAPAPPGTYHVRVIATNPCGQSAPSSSVTVVVP
ncbi:MAG: matrixin family metalloprotease [Vicinamibacterales bacterium]